MCCIFTCCGWMIDLIQRAWVFFMTCCIGTAVCCVFLVTSMSGVALGYNYSLAEYIELKETNVSVYLKRGMFDDEIGDDKDMRRHGGPHVPLSALEGDNMITAAPDGPEQMPDARRRLEDSILQSDEHKQFEGNLMKLTAKPPYETTVTEAVTSADKEMVQIMNKYPPGSPDQLKALQALINERKMKAPRDPNDKHTTTDDGYDASMLAHAPSDPVDYRRMMGAEKPPGIQGKNIDRYAAARKAVPDRGIGDRGNWMFPKMTAPNELYKEITYPKPVYINFGPIRPTQAIPSKAVPTPTNTAKQMEPTPMDPELLNREDLVGDFANKFGVQRPLGGDSIRPQVEESGGWKKSEMDYYDDEIKGLPVRKRRSINTIKNNLAKEPHLKINFSASDKENNARPNEITQDVNKFVSKLLFSNNPLSSEVTVSNDIEETTKIKTVMNGDNNFAKKVLFLEECH